MTVAYVDGVSGASGDMLLGAVLDAGWSPDELQRLLARFPITGWALHVDRVVKQGIAASQLRFDLPDGQPLRHLSDMLALLDIADLPAAIRAPAERTLRALATAEAAAHGIAVDRVHFHEVGALDTLFDVTGVVAGLAALGVERLYVGPMNVGGGTVRVAHGLLPVPPPAVALLARSFITYGAADAGELLTPTGAALLATLGVPRAAQPPLRVTAAGYGAGQKDLAHANIVRLILGDEAQTQPGAGIAAAVGPDVGHPATSRERLLLLSCNLDDMNPEWYSYLPERLFAAGALDVWLTPIIMKKGRPATLVNVLTDPQSADPLREALFRETSTLGVRSQDVQRDRLERRWERVTTPYGPIRLKIGLLGNEPVNRAPEYEDCAAAARAANVPIKTVYAAAIAAAQANGDSRQ